MKDILEMLEVNNGRIIEAHNRRAAFYLDVISQELDDIDAATRSAIDTVVSRIDSALLLSDPEIPLRIRRIYARFANLPEPRVNRLKERLMLLIINVQDRGLAATLKTIFKHSAAKAKPTGNIPMQ